MQPGAEQLVVRQHERFHCRLACQIRVADEAAEQVSLARAVGDGSGAVETVLTDCSRGGLGIESPVFYPRGCRLKIRLKNPPPQSNLSDLVVRVQRVSMVDRKPTYYLGVSYVSKGAEHDLAVATLLELARNAQPPQPSQTPASPTPAPSASGKGGA